MKIEKFFSLLEQDRATRESLAAEIQKLIEQESTLDGKMKDAAVRGDVDQYIEMNTEKGRVSAAIIVRRAQLDSLSSSVSADQAKEAWSDYVSDYNKRLNKSYSAFKALKDQLCKAFGDLIGLQKDACVVREKLAAAVGTDIDEYTMELIPVQSGANTPGSLRLAGSACVDPDAAFFLSNHVIKTGANFTGSSADPMRESVHNILINHRSH